MTVRLKLSLKLFVIFVIGSFYFCFMPKDIFGADFKQNSSFTLAQTAAPGKKQMCGN